MSSLAVGARPSAVWCSGKVFMSWSGSTPSLCVGKFEMVKRILSDRTGLYAKVEPGPVILALLGKGLVLTEGEDWVRHRRVVHPAFAMDKLKMLTGAPRLNPAWVALKQGFTGLGNVVERRAHQRPGWL
jgi:cytochrome P450